MDKIKVAITGATGRTSCYLVRKILAASDRFDTPKCLVRSVAKAKEKYEDVWDTLKDHCHEVDIVDDGSEGVMTELFKECNVIVILTSAGGEMIDGKFTFLPPDKGIPEMVYGVGHKNEINAAKKASIRHLLLVGSMGTTKGDLERFFGSLGYKRKAQEYLIASGLAYTIVNPCRLVDGEEGTRELVFSKGDKLKSDNYAQIYHIARKSVAEVLFQAILVPEAKNKAFDLLGCVGVPPAEPVDYVTLFKGTTQGL